MISSFDLALVGVFSENTGSIHGVVSEVFFAMIVITMLTFSYVSWPLDLHTSALLPLSLEFSPPSFGSSNGLGSESLYRRR